MLRELTIAGKKKLARPILLGVKKRGNPCGRSRKESSMRGISIQPKERKENKRRYLDLTNTKERRKVKPIPREKEGRRTKSFSKENSLTNETQTKNTKKKKKKERLRKRGGFKEIFSSEWGKKKKYSEPVNLAEDPGRNS